MIMVKIHDKFNYNNLKPLIYSNTKIKVFKYFKFYKICRIITQKF